MDTHALSLEKWSENVEWEILCAKTITRVDGSYGKITLDDGNSYYIREFGGLVYLQISPEVFSSVENLGFLEKESIIKIGGAYPPRKEGINTKKTLRYETPYAKAHMLSNVLLYTQDYPDFPAYSIHTDISQTPSKIKVVKR